MTARIGILGGMFDPVHNGHMQAARTALQLLEFDLLRLVPCHVPNHRNLTLCSAVQRVAMLELACERDEKIVVDEIEIRRGGISYAVDTLKQFKQEYLEANFFFVLGSDSFDSLPQWHKWQDLFELCHFAILNRASFDISESTRIATAFDLRKVKSNKELFAAPSGKIIVVEDFDYPLSSSQVRARLGANESMDGFLDESVARYIRSNNLYHSEVVRN